MTTRTNKLQIVSRGRLIFALGLGLIGAVVASQLDWNSARPTPLSDPSEHSPSGTSIVTLEQLASALETEVEARTNLADRIEELENELSRLRRTDQEEASNALALGDSPNEADDLTTLHMPDPSAGSSGFNDEALLSRGIHPNDVARLRDLWESDELERAAIANQALREGWFLKDRHRNELAQLTQELREDLDDEEYDRYLYALGEPNRLKAGDVLRGSAASEAGLQRGDFILSYGGVRVFKPGELLLASATGEPGDSVPVVVVRDGVTRTIHLRRGPLGVMIEHSRGEPLSR